MKSRIFLSLALTVAALGCSSSGSGASPGGSDDASTGQTGNDASTGNSTPDSSTGTSNDATSGNQNPDSSTGADDDATTGTQNPDSSTSTSNDAATGGDTGTNEGDAGSGSNDAGTADAGPLSFNTDIFTPIIEVHCVGCHSGSGSGVSGGKLDMSSADAGYANLVNVVSTGAACGSSGETRVVPGNAASSLLYQKVNGFTTAPPCGAAMPKSGEIPNGGQAVVVTQIQTWINQGAQP
jgi:hypothetical protein